MANFPSDMKYTKDHEWIISKDGKTATVGVTSYAIEQLGDIVHIELPKEGESFDAGASFGTIESTKTVSDLYLPVAGKIVAVNQEIKSALESIVDDPYEKGWLVKIEMNDKSEYEALLSSSQYNQFIADQEG